MRGHSAAGGTIAGGAVRIDLSRLSGVRVDPEARRAYVGGGAAWADVDAATTPTASRWSAARSVTPESPGSR